MNLLVILSILSCLAIVVNAVCVPAGDEANLASKRVVTRPPAPIGTNCTTDYECDEEICHSIQLKCGQSACGSSCTRDLDCASLNCINSKCSPKITTTPCNKQSDCNKNFKCLLVDGTGQCTE